MKRIGCIMPCYLGGATTIKTCVEVLKYVDYLVLVDDKCPNKTGEKVLQLLQHDERLKVVFNEHNMGVGASCKIGFKFLLQLDAEIIVKIDADGQMDPRLIPNLIQPILEGKSQAVKGNRFTSLDHLNSMPLIRLWGNLVLSFLNKLSSGYWELFDPTNGFIAFKGQVISRIPVDKLDNRYFFESDLLFRCSIENIVFSQLPMPSQYFGEVSSLRPLSEISRFSKRLICNFFKRICFQYYLLDFNIGSLELLGALIVFVSLLLNCLYVFLKGVLLHEYATPGEANLIGILSVFLMQLVLGFLYFDATQKPLMRRLSSVLD